MRAPAVIACVREEQTSGSVSNHRTTVKGAERDRPKFQFVQRTVRQCHSFVPRSEEHTSELQSPCNLVCRLLLEKKKKKSSHTKERIYKKKKNEYFNFNVGVGIQASI